jgi:hypothetical protein
MEFQNKNKIVEWLLNGVTYKEIQERMSWLGIVITFEEIKKIENEVTLE